ncbi:MAG TPA: aspartyl-phosphate phosphatase Spo0E family protein [Bacillaceae bacterium]
MYVCKHKQQKYLERIQQKREEMFLLGETYGLCAYETVACSRELDQMLNEYYWKFQTQRGKDELSLSKKLTMILFPKEMLPSNVQSSR